MQPPLARRARGPWRAALGNPQEPQAEQSERHHHEGEPPSPHQPERQVDEAEQQGGDPKQQ